MPRCTASIPRSRVITINFPRRTTLTMVRSVRCDASFRRSPGVTKREVKDALRMRRPVRCGASVRTTFSTSGNSGTLRKLDQNVVALYLHGEFCDLDVV